MNKLLPVVIGTGLLISGAANAADIKAPTVYGRAHIQVGMIDNENGSATQVSSRASRFGIKGDYELDAGITAVYKLEFEVNISDDAKSGDDHIKGRAQYAGIKGSFGEIRVGRHDTAYKSSTSKFELWGDTYADYNNILDKSEHDERADNSINYLNKFNDFSLAISYAAGDSDKDNITDDNEKSRFSIGGKYKVGGLLIGGGYEDVDSASSAAKIGASYNFDAFTLGGVVESVDKEAAGEDETNILLTASVKVGKNGSIKAVYGKTDIDDSSVEDPTMIAIGYNHKFNKKASIYVQAVSSQDDGMSEAGKVSGDATVFATGLKFNF